MGTDYIALSEAAARSGLHPNTLRRLLREGVLRGFKARGRWLVSVASLREYSHPTSGWLLDLPGPKLFLRRAPATDDDDRR